MKKNPVSSNPENPASMDDFLQPLSQVQSVDAPYFLKTRIMARIAAQTERVPARTLAVALAGFAMLLALSVLAVAQTETSGTESYYVGLAPHNQLYR